MNRATIGFLGCLFFGIVFPCSAQGANLKVATLDTPLARITYRLLQTVFAENGHTSSIAYLPAKRSLVEVSAGRADVEMGRISGFENEFPNLVRIPEPIVVISFSAIVKGDSPHQHLTWEDIKTMRFAYQLGIKFIEMRTGGGTGYTPITEDAILNMVSLGRAEAGLMATTDAKRLVKEFEGLRVVTPPLETLPLYIYLHVKHKNLVPELTATITELYRSGRAQNIMAGQPQ